MTELLEKAIELARKALPEQQDRVARRLIDSLASEDARQEVIRQKEAQWREENREAIEWYNDYIAQNGLPLARYRRF